MKRRHDEDIARRQQAEAELSARREALEKELADRREALQVETEKLRGELEGSYHQKITVREEELASKEAELSERILATEAELADQAKQREMRHYKEEKRRKERIQQENQERYTRAKERLERYAREDKERAEEIARQDELRKKQWLDEDQARQAKAAQEELRERQEQERKKERERQAAIDQAKPVTISGYLVKQGGQLARKKWQKRFFLFNSAADSNLRYFKNEEDSKNNKLELGHIDLNEVISLGSVDGVHGVEKLPAFCICLSQMTRLWFVCASNADEELHWCSELMRAISQLRPTTPFIMGGPKPVSDNLDLKSMLSHSGASASASSSSDHKGRPRTLKRS